MSLQGSLEVAFAGQRFVLLPDRAAWWPEREMLIVADVHLGKATAFRAAGLPVPTGSSVKDLARLSLLLRQMNARRLLILGDLIHAKRSRDADLSGAIEAWRGEHPMVEMLLVRGNHDRSAGRAEAAWGLNEHEASITLDGITFTHAPNVLLKGPVMAGHVHPVFAMRDYDGSSVAIDCFVFDGDCAVLPAFGTFTGGCRMGKREGRRVYLTTGKTVVAVGDL